MEKTVLTIGRDRTGLTPGSQLYERLKLYDTKIKMVHIIMGVGDAAEIAVGRSRVIAPGGKNFVSAFLKALVMACREVKETSVTVVSTQDVLYAGLVGYIATRVRRVPLYVQVHGDYLDNPKWYQSKVGFGNRIMNPVGKWILRQADGVRSVSRRLSEQLTNQFGIDAERIISIPIGTDLTLFGELPTYARERRLLFVGRLIPEKEPMLFCEVAAAVALKDKTVTIGIAGDGFMREEMEAYFAERGLASRVTFYGNLTQATLAPIYAQSYAYIHTAGWEGWGMPMIESIAAGCPVVTTDSGCAGEAIRHNETGLVVPVGDVSGLIRETERLLADAELWQELMLRGKTESALWSLHGLTDKLIAWYERA